MNRNDLLHFDGRKVSPEQGLEHEDGVENRQQRRQADVVDPRQDYDMRNPALGKYISFQSCKCVFTDYGIGYLAARNAKIDHRSKRSKSVTFSLVSALEYQLREKIAIPVVQIYGFIWCGELIPIGNRVSDERDQCWPTPAYLLRSGSRVWRLTRYASSRSATPLLTRFRLILRLWTSSGDLLL